MSWENCIRAMRREKQEKSHLDWVTSKLRSEHESAGEAVSVPSTQRDTGHSVHPWKKEQRGVSQSYLWIGKEHLRIFCFLLSPILNYDAWHWKRMLLLIELDSSSSSTMESQLWRPLPITPQSMWAPLSEGVKPSALGYWTASGKIMWTQHNTEPTNAGHIWDIINHSLIRK